MLKEFIYWVEQRDCVQNHWGAQASSGPVALFSGVSGTGKTFAASVIARHLNYQLYRVDLGNLVSKYIGETEKNLNALFDAVHGKQVLLQFDEADALFGKRGDIKEARDRYANMEVSHLLARIESHHGPVILTTNLRKHLDAAFARRFQVVVEFPRPDLSARLSLWARLLPPGAPRSADLDLSTIAESVALSGGQIKNAALHSAFLAAAAGTAIGMSQIALAVWRELGKSGRDVRPQDLGGLRAWLGDENKAQGTAP